MTTTANNESAAAVIAAVEYTLDEGVEVVGNLGHENYGRMVAGRTAFAAILDRVAALEAENARLKAFVGTIAEWATDNVGLTYYESKEYGQQAAALLAADESEAKP